MNKKIISDLLERFKIDDKVILELEKYNIREIAEVALTEKKYDAYIKLFQPIEIDNVVKIYYDYFSQTIGGKLDNIYNSLEIDSEVVINIENNIYKLLTNEKIKKIKIGDSHARTLTGGDGAIKTEKDVIKFAEPACLESLLYCYRNNIVTSSCDTECVLGETEEKGFCDIWIVYSKLSKENKVLADELISMGHAKMVKTFGSEEKHLSIFVPCSKTETIGEISDKLFGIISKFKLQDIQKYTINEAVFERIYNRLFVWKIVEELKILSYEEIKKIYIEELKGFDLTEVENDLFSKEDLLLNIPELVDEKKFIDKIIYKVISKMKKEECIEFLKNNSTYYIVQDTNEVFNNEKDYLKHKKYIAMKENEENKGKEMINMENIRNYDEDIMLAIDNIDLFDDGTTEKLSKEWESIRNEVIAINDKYKDNEFFKNNALEKYKKIYLKKLLETDELNNPDLYEYYTLILEFLGVNSYILESEMQKLNGTSRKK